MSAAVVAGAASDSGVNWHGIDWANCHKRVRKLQARIVKAVQEGRWNKVKVLQWLLTHSFSGKGIAVKRVTENQGKKTPGVDGETWSTPKSKSNAILLLSRKGYNSLPLRRVYIPKANGEKRPLGIPRIKDRALQALHWLALDPVPETMADGNSFGFRPERSTVDALEQCFTALSRGFSPTWVLAGDIKGCFDNISHEWLLENIPMDKGVLKKWLKAGYLYSKKLFPTESGTPHGGIISPTLANMTLDGIEKELTGHFGEKHTSKKSKNQVNLVRYADDFIMTGRTKELLESEVKPIVERFLKDRGLTLSQEKTKIVHIEQGFDFLGWNMSKYDGKLLIKPSKKNTERFLRKIRETVKTNKTAGQEDLIRILNPKISGWANYHKGAVAKEVFKRVDTEIWKATWQWAKRCHPHKGLRWIKERYFSRIKSRKGVFAASAITKNGKPIPVKLAKASDTKIVRHLKITAEATPYDPPQEQYFEGRLGSKMEVSLIGKAKLKWLWWSQEKRCPHCGEKITKETGWHVHHILPKSEGGKDNIGNLALVHPNCHRQIHRPESKCATGS